MILCEIFLLGCAFVLCGLSVWTDLRHGQIKNKHLIVGFAIGLVLNVIYYAVYCQDCLGITALNLLISALLSIGFYFVHIWSAGDSKLMIVLISLLPGRLFWANTDTIVPAAYLFLLVFSIGYLYLIGEAVYLDFHRHTVKLPTVTKAGAWAAIKPYLHAFVVLYAWNSVLSIALPFFVENNVLLLSLISYFLITILREKPVYHSKVLVGSCAVLDAAVLLLLLREASGRKQIEHGLKEIAAGDLDYKIDLTELQGEDNLQLAGIVNSLGEGMKAAVQEQMKSERLKADLITNVSHDIKTPLTSIINYVDLLKRENIENEKAKDYIRVLDEKSQRLKQLTEDLVEASKISSGNIKLEFMNLNLNELVQQVNGEFAERFEGRNLDLICILQPEPLLIRADSRRIWRVLENLYVNVCKYAMPGTRVYVDAIKKDGKIQLSIKNISENPLNFQADELTERFIRGDVSRSTEGSGLGLSIAKNLTVLQHGSFNIYLDGDLFKVTITFDEAVKEKKPMPPMIVPEAVQEEAQQDA